MAGLCWSLLFFVLLLPDLSRGTVLSVAPADYVLWHNAFRCLHNSPPVVWDETLASSAQTWAQTCSGYHSTGIPYGENLWGDSVYLGTAQEVISYWYDEINLYNWTIGGYQTDADHFTQIVWSSSVRIGCAACKNDANMRRYVVCQYSPAGNAPGFPVHVLPAIKPQSSCFPTPSPKSCDDYPADWADYYGHTCAEYTANHWCENGAVGEGWPSNLPSMAEYWDVKYGLSALEACCDCGGGAHPSPSPTSESPYPSPKSPSPSPTPSRKPSRSAIPSRSRSRSGLPSRSPSHSSRPSMSTSRMASISPSVSASPSNTASPSNNASPSPMASISPVQDDSPMPSPSVSPPPSSCKNYPADWVDYIGHSCQQYAENQWCLGRTQGPGWPTYYNSISDYWDNKYGLTAYDACCACGGGRTVTASPTSTITTTGTATMSATNSRKSTSSATVTSTSSSTATSTATSTWSHSAGSIHGLSNEASTAETSTQGTQTNGAIPYWVWIVVTFGVTSFIVMTVLGMWWYQRRQKQLLKCLQPLELYHVSLPADHMLHLHPGQVTPMEGYDAEDIVPTYHVPFVTPAGSPEFAYTTEAEDRAINGGPPASFGDMSQVLR